MKIMVTKMKEDIVKVHSSTKLSIAFLNSLLSNDVLMKNMSKKRKSFLLGCIITTLLITGLQETAKALPTDWKIVDMSMTQLLNSGWQIAGHSSNRAAVGNAGSANNYDNTDFTYLGDCHKRKYQLVGSNNNIPFRQQGISVQARFNLFHF